jgi:hypothetical protein
MMPCTPLMMPAVGKSGPGMYFISSADADSSGSSIRARQPSITSPRLWGGMLVAMPTAMPEEPLTSRFGTWSAAPRLGLGAVVVGHEVDGFLVDVGQQLVGDARHAHFGVTHGRRGVAVDRAEVALAVDQQVAHGERLRHAHDGVVHRRVAVGVVFTDDVTDHAGGLLVGLVPVVAELAHGVQHAAMHRLQTVPHIRAAPARRSRSWRSPDRTASSRLRD